MCVNNTYSFLIGLLFFSFLTPGLTTLQAQTDSEKKSYYKWFDNSVGNQNTDLYNGTIFINRYRTIGEKHRFFEVEDFLEGSVTYDGNNYYDLQMQYDVYQDQLIVKLKQGYADIALQLIKDKVDAFEIGKTPFVRVANDSMKQIGSDGFYEVLLQDPKITLLKKHSKGRQKRVRNGQSYYDFVSKVNYVVYYKEEYYPAKSKSDVLDVFPELKQDINDYYSSSRKLLKTNPDAFRSALFKKLISLISNTNNS